MDHVLTVLDLLGLETKEKNDLKLSVISGRVGLVRKITCANINRPGLAITGYYENFAYDRIQVLGKGELSYIQKLENENNLDSLKQFFSYDETPCIIISAEEKVNQTIIDFSEKYNIPLLRTELDSSEFAVRIMSVLSYFFAPSKIEHATLIEVYGIGVLILGESGIGKSETALELLVRGHRLIADDAVEIKCLNNEVLIGKDASEVTKHHIEVRGLGILNVIQLFGVGAIRDKKQIQLAVKLEEWIPEKSYERFGETHFTEYLGFQIPLIEIPVKPGRNIPVLVEIAAMNERLKKLGYNSAEEFNENMLNWLENQNRKDTFKKYGEM